MMSFFCCWTRILLCLDISIHPSSIWGKPYICKFFNIITLVLQVDFVGAHGLLWCKPSVEMLTALKISFSFLLLFSSPVSDLFNDSFMRLWCFLPDNKRLVGFWCGFWWVLLLLLFRMGFFVVFLLLLFLLWNYNCLHLLQALETQAAPAESEMCNCTLLATRSCSWKRGAQWVGG